MTTKRSKRNREVVQLDELIILVINETIRKNLPVKHVHLFLWKLEGLKCIFMEGYFIIKRFKEEP
jgi:hypothetical protein